MRQTHRLYSREVTPSRVLLLLLQLTLMVSLACDAEPHATAPQSSGVETSPAGRSGAQSAFQLSSIGLPYRDSAATPSGEINFWIIQGGGGSSGFFQVTNKTNFNPALIGYHSGNGDGVQAISQGGGSALNATTIGTGRAAYFTSVHNANPSPAVEIYSVGLSHGLWVQSANTQGRAGYFQKFGVGATSPTLEATFEGSGTVLLVNHRGSSGNLAVFKKGASNRVRFDLTGKGFFNGGTQTGGADVAEAFEVEGLPSSYTPGDVLVISTRSDRRVEKSAQPYSTRVVGVYATKPGVLLTERDIDERLEDMVPVGVVGVIPTKVSAENGPIGRGDLLVSAGTIGYAMKGTNRNRMLGAIVGKALEEFPGPGTGRIQVMVNVK